MGRSHAKAYHTLEGFNICGVVTRSLESRSALISDLNLDCPGFSDVATAIAETRPNVVSISSYPDTHAAYTEMALRAGADVFVEKPIASTIEDAERIVDLAHELGRKIIVGYILRQHPSWVRFIEIAQGLGNPLVMRMNLNQQSSGGTWETHKNLLSSVSPIVDCGVHYVDVMCQMTRSRPIRVSSIGARLSDELSESTINYGQLQVTFENGSIGWYEVGWGPMMSETAFFIKDVIGPKGSVSITAKTASSQGASDSIDAHSQTESLRLHHSDRDQAGHFSKSDEWIDMTDEPDHDSLCLREQEYLFQAITEDLDLTNHLDDALSSLRIVFAAEKSFRTGKTVELLTR